MLNHNGKQATMKKSLEDDFITGDEFLNLFLSFFNNVKLNRFNNCKLDS